MSDSNLRIPNLGGPPGTVPVRSEPAQAPDRKGDGAVPQETFSSFLQKIQGERQGQGVTSAAPVKPGLTEGVGGSKGLQFSAHAQARLRSRNIQLGPDQMLKLKEAVDRAAAKGLDDTLILTPEAAFIVSVQNRTVVTAMDRSQLDGNVFTNIEGAVIV